MMYQLSADCPGVGNIRVRACLWQSACRHYGLWHLVRVCLLEPYKTTVLTPRPEVLQIQWVSGAPGLP